MEIIAMFMFDKTMKAGFFSIALLFLSVPAVARNLKEGGKGKEQKNISSISHKTVELIRSDENIDLTTSNGQSVSLPKVDKVFIEHPSLIVNDKTLAAAINITYATSTKLAEKFIEEREIKELSQELGIDINSNQYLDLYREVINWIGTPYRYGSMSSKGVDCSGFTGLIFKAVFDMSLPRASVEISNKFKDTVAKDDLEPGDLVFFSTRGRKRINHVGIYIGDNKFIHASRTSGVKVDSLSDPYYSRSWKRGARAGF